jgi:hypothetical protein
VDADEGEALLTRLEAIRILGISPSTFARRVRDGLLVGTLINGQKLYSREEVELTRLETEDDAEKSLTATLATLREVVRDMQKQANEAWAMARTSMESAYGATRDENTALRARAASADATWLESRKLIEDLTNEAHKRQLEQAASQASERRTDEMWELFTTLAPDLVSQVFGVAGVGKFLRSLNENQLRFLVEDETADSVLSPEQRSLLKTALERFRKVKPDEPKQAVDSGEPASQGHPSARE